MMEPEPNGQVRRSNRRLSPTLLAAIALVALLLLVVALVTLRGRGTEDDRLTDSESASAKDDPEKRCAAQSTYDGIKRELFRRAAQVRGSDQAAFDKLSAYSTVRMRGPILRDENEEIGSVTCSGDLSLDLPPGVAVVGGRRTLSAEILYTIQRAADGSGNVVTLSNADEIITPLATLARIGGATAPPNPADPTYDGPEDTTPAVEPGVALPPPPQAPAPSRPERSDTAEPPRTTASPSFNCGNARSRGEIAVCNNSGLAALDRRMASQFNSALSSAGPAERRLLLRTRDSFLTYRDRCPSNACIAETYRGRMREISDIMAGRWQPR